MNIIQCECNPFHPILPVISSGTWTLSTTFTPDPNFKHSYSDSTYVEPLKFNYTSQKLTQITKAQHQSSRFTPTSVRLLIHAN